jgi:hypothetical protein
MSKNERSFALLSSSNWGQWADNMEAYLSTKELWEYINELTSEPTPADANKPTTDEKQELAEWRRKRAKASGEIWLAIEDSQKVHVKDSKGDPPAMWAKLEAIHVQKKPGARFNAYQTLLGIRKDDNESLSDLMARADKAIQDIKALRPSTFTLDDLDNELLSMSLIRALPSDYKNFVSSLLLLDSLNIDKLKSAFQTEEIQRISQIDTSTLAYVSQLSSILCSFCGIPGHLEKDCHKKKKASEQAKERTKNRVPGKKYTKEAKETSPAEKSNAATIEFAGNASALSSQVNTRASTDWNPDTGASSHMTPHRHWFRSYSPHVIPVRLADNTIIYSAGLGSVEFKPEGLDPVIFHDVFHVPALGSNLLSLFHLTRVKGYKIGIENDQVLFYRDNKLMFTATVNGNNVGHLNGQTIIPHSASAVSTCPVDLTLWHHRFSHLNYNDVKEMYQKGKVIGMIIQSNTKPDPICESCIFGKQRRHHIPKTASRKTTLLALVHTDLKGPLPVESLEGHKYWQAFVDDNSRWLTVAFLKRKTQALQSFKQFKAHAENQLGCKIKGERDDKGGEFISKEFNDFCAENGIVRQHSEPNEPHQNGVAEKANQDIAAAATAMLVQAKLPPSFWNLAVAAYVHTTNRSPSSALNGETPYFLWKKKKPNVSYFRVFGCLAYVLVRKENRRALEPHSRKCIFVGYPEGVKAWKFWDPVNRKFIISSHAVFDERYFPGNSPTTIHALDSLPPIQSTQQQQVVLHQGGDTDDVVVRPPVAAPAPTPPLDPLPEQAEEQPAPFADVLPDVPEPERLPEPRRQNPPRTSRFVGSFKETASRQRPRHVSPPPSPLPESSSDELNPRDDNELEVNSVVEQGLQYVFTSTIDDYLTLDEGLEYAFHAYTTALKTSSHDNEPRTFKEAMQRSPDERAKWYKAATDEIQALVDNGTFELVQLPPGRKAIGSRWVFKVKRNADGSIERYKARVVAQGFAQRPGFDYTETFAPTPKWAALRAILAIAAIEDLELESVDISSAYLNGQLEEEVYMRQPEGFVENGNDWFWRLYKSLYGLKQAGRCWHNKLNEVLEQMGFKRLICEHSIWVYSRGTSRIIIPVFIDDMTIAAKTKEEIAQVKDELKAHFKLRDLGPTSWLLGVEIKRNRSKCSITLSQRQYILDILQRFNMEDCKPVSTPIDPSVRLSSSMSPQSSADVKFMQSVPYLQAVGALMYLATATRPDIAYAVGVLARFNKDPGLLHWKAVKHLFRYLKGTLDYKLTYSPTASLEPFVAYSDADHAGNPDNGRSTSGYIVKMGTGAISWSSRLQTIVALSSTEAEYIAAVSAGQEIIWLRNLLSELGYTLSFPSTLHIDNNSALSVAKNPEHHGRMKHLDLRFYWLRNEVEKGTIVTKYLPTDEMPADILTKALGRVKVEEMVKLIGLTI